MAYENILFDWTFPVAGARVLADQFRFVTVGTNGTVTTSVAPGAAGSVTFPVGVIQDSVLPTGSAAQVRLLGISKVVVGAATLAVGAAVTSDANGAAVAQTTVGCSVIGRVLVGGTTGALATILMTGPFTL